MLEIGKFNTLTVTEHSPAGATLQNENGNAVLLPASELGFSQENYPAIGASITVYIYYDQSANLLASTLKVPLQVDEFAVLVSTGSNDIGAFFDWKLPRDLLVPKSFQHKPLDAGLAYVVRLIHDEERQKLVGSTKIHRYLNESGDDLSEGQEVDLMVFDSTNLGYKAIVNGTHQGLLYHSDLFMKLKTGQRLTGYIKSIREDGKIDLSLQKPGKEGRIDLFQQILDDLEAHGGISTITDKSPADEIFARYSVSKGAYKRALGNLYKKKKINIEKSHISLPKKG